MKSTNDIAKECGAEENGYYSSIDDSSVYTYLFTAEDLDQFRKAVEDDFIARCELVAWQDKFRNLIKDDSKKHYIKMSCQTGHSGFDIPLFTLPKD